ncbi:uncharacterized protein K02A2.6-like [Aedes albopictus]|uniref:RNA-directed DNA polymerase n=2 Tax=Aedes albopictus TaxID=7160 RepID=A0ABM1ZYC7_AEDAL
MAASASFRCYDGECEEWELYKEQLEQFFVSNRIPNDMRKAVLINHLSAKTYKLLRDLCTPDQPKEKDYDFLCKALSTHFTPPVIVHKKRRVFFRAQRGENGPETVNDWIVRIKNLAANCKFGDQLSHVLVNKFVDGLSGKAFDRICEEDEKLSLDRAQEIALKYELEICANVNYTRGGRLPGTKTAEFGAKQQQRRDKQQFSGGAMRCLVCNRTGHLRKDCRYRNLTCNKCNKKGHLQAACGNQQAFYVTTAERADREEDLDNESSIELEQNYISKSTISVNKIASTEEEGFKVEVRIANQVHRMEIDSGAGVCVFPESLYRESLSSYQLKETSLKLMLYSGQRLQVIGAITPVIEYNGSCRTVLVAIVKENGPALLGKNFMKAFGIRLALVNKVVTGTEEKLAKLLDKYSGLFSDELGKYKYETVSLEVEETARPVFKKPRQVPFKFQEKMIRQLDDMERSGIITKCDSSPWATPLVPVLKPDGELRLCGDYKVTVNKHVKDVKHPLPTADEIFAKLNGGKKFSKLDLSKAYNQFELSESSKELCAISTVKGVYRMNRLPFGVKPASGIVQRELEKLFCGIPGVQNFLDDAVVTGDNDEEHLERLEKVFDVLDKAGLKLNKEKCQFFKSDVNFLGYTVNEDGLKKTDERIRSIRDAPEPKNVSEVRAFAGLVNYYAKFVKNLATLMSPIYKLLKKGVKFEWTAECREAFTRVKGEICRDITLAHFDPAAKIILTCDASNVGVSAVLSQVKNGVERPVAFASRILHASEVNYSVIDREALAIMYGLNKYFLYLVGNKFSIRTDHKPLLSLFHPHKGIPTIAASRLQRWAHFLSGFNYDIGHVSSQLNVADFPSRFPTESWKLWKEEDSYLNFINRDECGLVSLEELKLASEKDEHLNVAMQYLTGKTNKETLERGPYSRIIDELSLESGIIMRGHRVVVPSALRKKVLNQMHSSHLGIVKTKSIARANVWWPNIDYDIECTVKSCSSCVLHNQSPPKAQLIPWEPPTAAWSRVHVDFAGPVNGWSFLIIIDAFSKWAEVFPTKHCTSDFVLEKLMECIARFGLFDEIVSDNGTQFVAGTIKMFLSANGIKQILTSPGHPSTNGEAENMVKTFKATLIKSLSEGDKDVRGIVANFLLGYRKAVHCTTQLSPAQAMLGRDIKSTLDRFNPRHVSQDKEVVARVTQNIRKQQKSQIKNYRGTRNSSFAVGDRVIVRDYRDPNKPSWTSAVVREIVGQRNYRVELAESGRVIKRHLDQMRLDTRPITEVSANEQTTEKRSSPRRYTDIKQSLAPVKRTLPGISPAIILHRENSVQDEVQDERVRQVLGSPPTEGIVNRQVSISPPNAAIVNDTEDDFETLSNSFEGLFIDERRRDEQNESSGSEFYEASDGPGNVEANVSADSDDDLVVSGFARGFWRLRDKQGKIYKK